MFVTIIILFIVVYMRKQILSSVLFASRTNQMFSPSPVTPEKVSGTQVSQISNHIIFYVNKLPNAGSFFVSGGQCHLIHVTIIGDLTGPVQPPVDIFTNVSLN